MSLIAQEETQNFLEHYGIKRRSGRYPWGSGQNPQAARDFLGDVEHLRSQGLTDLQIVEGLGLQSTTELRELKTIAKNAQKMADISLAESLREKGWSHEAIGQRFDPPKNESSVRALLAPAAKEKAQVLTNIADNLEREVNEKGFIQVGDGVAQSLGISTVQLNTALTLLRDRGYSVETVQINQLGTAAGNKTLVKVLAGPGHDYQSVKANIGNVKHIGTFSDDQGSTIFTPKPPLHIDPSRVAVKYGDEGGAELDGVVYVRPGIDDLSLGGKRYAQVRIAVGDDRYIKGMAMYKDDLPDGVDLQFNTNKTKDDVGGDKMAALKKMERDLDGNIDTSNPFGSQIRRQILTRLPDGTEVPTSAMNIVYEEGSWGRWSQSLASQVLSKQTPRLAQDRLDAAYRQKKEDLDEIMQLTNPAVKRRLLDAYASDADASSVHLKAAAMPRQAWQVILPINTLKPSEVYAPNFHNGEKVALIRYPHGGTFEIPELTVNNNHAPAKKLLGRAQDAVGIHSKVAERLSGADFDGDTVLVIPNDRGDIRTSAPLQKLQGFDPKVSYRPYDGMKTIDGGVYNAKLQKVEYPGGKKPNQQKGTQMGLVSNLITDMTIKNASSDELAAAVRHSMVVIDAEKHGLDYKRSARENGIPALMKRYQGRSQGGADTLISKASSVKKVLARKRIPKIDPDTGKKIWVETGENWPDKKTGKTIWKTQNSTKMDETDDAFTLSSGTKIETVYANHANRMKALANTARKEMVSTQTIPYSRTANQTYRKQVETLDSKLNEAFRNRPLERQAQIIANTSVAQKKAANPHLDRDDIRTVERQALAEARTRTGARRRQIDITPSEWDAIQAGAITNTKLNDILRHADLEKVRELATPRTKLMMTSGKQAQARSLMAKGLTQAEVAKVLGVSLTTLKTGLSGEGGA